MNTLEFIYNKYQVHEWDIVSNCCHAGYSFIDDKLVCDKCSKPCTTEHIDLPAKMPISLPITRNDLVDLFYKLGLSVGAEIGVERGLYSEVIMASNPLLTAFHMVDPLKAYRGYREHVSQDKMDGFYLEALERTSKEKFPNCERIFHRKFSMDAVKEFKDNSLDFVYIDGNHDFVNTTLDISEWSKKVRPGGIIAGHDYVRNKKKDYKCHVKDVVQAWTYANGIRPWFITSQDKSPSYFWVKES